MSFILAPKYTTSIFSDKKFFSSRNFFGWASKLFSWATAHPRLFLLTSQGTTKFRNIVSQISPQKWAGLEKCAEYVSSFCEEISHFGWAGVYNENDYDYEDRSYSIHVPITSVHFAEIGSNQRVLISRSLLTNVFVCLGWFLFYIRHVRPLFYRTSNTLVIY